MSDKTFTACQNCKGSGVLWDYCQVHCTPCWVCGGKGCVLQPDYLSATSTFDSWKGESDG